MDIPARQIEAFKQIGVPTPIVQVAERFIGQRDAIRASMFQKEKENTELSRVRAAATRELETAIAAEVADAERKRDAELKALEVEIKRDSAPVTPQGDLELDAKYQQRLSRVLIDETRRTRAAVFTQLDAEYVAHSDDAQMIATILDGAIESGDPDAVARIGPLAELRLKRMAEDEAREKGLDGSRPARDTFVRVSSRLAEWRAAQDRVRPEARRQAVVDRWDIHVRHVRGQAARLRETFNL